MKRLSKLVERDTIWWTAWSLIPVALVVNVLLAYDYESSLRWRERAQIEAAVENWEDAARLFEAAAQASPQASDLAYNAGVAYRNLGDLDRARYWNRMALVADRGFQPALDAARSLDAESGRQRDGSTLVQRPFGP